MLKKLDKKVFIYLGIIISFLVILIIAGFVVYFLIKKAEIEIKPLEPKIEEPKPLSEEIIKSLTAPSGVKPQPLPKEVIESLTAPSKTKPEPLSDEVIKSLTAPRTK